MIANSHELLLDNVGFLIDDISPFSLTFSAFPWAWMDDISTDSSIDSKFNNDEEKRRKEWRRHSRFIIKRRGKEYGRRETFEIREDSKVRCRERNHVRVLEQWGLKACNGIDGFVEGKKGKEGGRGEEWEGRGQLINKMEWEMDKHSGHFVQSRLLLVLLVRMRETWPLFELLLTNCRSISKEEGRIITTDNEWRNTHYQWEIIGQIIDRERCEVRREEKGGEGR